jgi:hypothetical protein
MNAQRSVTVKEAQRRSKRLPLQVPVNVYGRTPENYPFRDRTRTLTVDAHGARLTLSADVKPGQSLLLVHSFTQEERECRVVHVGPKRNGKRKVGVEFAQPEDNFWHIFQPVVLTRPPQV